jgi:hypothetical protein
MKRRGKLVVRQYDGGRLTHRRKGRFFEAVLVFGFGLFVARWLAVQSDTAWGGNAGAFAFVAGFALALVAVWRTLGVSVTVDASAIEIKNYFRDYVIPWVDVASITRKDSRMRLFRERAHQPVMVRLDLQNGATRYASATAVLAGAFSPPDVRILRAIEVQAQAHGVKCEELDSAALADMGLSDEEESQDG